MNKNKNNYEVIFNNAVLTDISCSTGNEECTKPQQDPIPSKCSVTFRNSYLLEEIKEPKERKNIQQ